MRADISFMTELPDGVFSNIVMEWLSVKWFCRFDAALCNKRLRAEYRRVLHSGNMIYDGMPISLLSQCESYFKWTLDRGIFTRACDIHSGMDSATIEWILCRNAQHLSWLTCHNFNLETSDTVCQLIDKTACKLTKLYVIGGNWNVGLRKILLSQFNLTRLYLVAVSELQPETFEVLSSLKLEVLSLEKCVLNVETARSLASLLSSHLVKLNLTHCTLTHDVLLPIAELCTKLSVLGIRGSKTITDTTYHHKVRFGV